MHILFSWPCLSVRLDQMTSWGHLQPELSCDPMTTLQSRPAVWFCHAAQKGEWCYHIHVAQQVTAAWPVSLLEVSGAMHWLDYSSVPAAQDVAKHLLLFELIGRMCVALWCPPSMAITKGLVVPGSLWSLQVVVAHPGQKCRLCALCLCFLEVLYSFNCWHEISVSMMWLSPLSSLSVLYDPPQPRPR